MALLGNNEDPAIDLLGNTPRMPDDRPGPAMPSVARALTAFVVAGVWIVVGIATAGSGHDHFKRWLVVMINAVVVTLLEAVLPQVWDRDDWTPTAFVGLMWLLIVSEMWLVVVGSVREISVAYYFRYTVAPSDNWLAYDLVQRGWRFAAILLMTGFCGWWLATVSRRAQAGDWPKASALAATIAAFAVAVWMLVN